MSKLQEKQQEVIKLRTEIKTIFDAKPDRDFTDDEFTRIKTLSDALAPLAEELDRLNAIEVQAKQNEEEHERLTRPMGIVHPSGTTKAQQVTPEFKHPREVIAESDGFKYLESTGFKVSGRTPTLYTFPQNAEGKTLVDLSVISPANVRESIEPYARDTRTVRDLMSGGTTTANTIEYYTVTTPANAAAPVAEGAAKPEAALGFTLTSDSARKIAVWIPVTDEALRDNTGMDGLIRGELLADLRLTEEEQIINGSGTAPALRGILNRTGVQTQAKGADSVPVAIFKAINKVRNTGFAEPSGLVMHPNDFQDLVLLQDTTGRFLFLDSITQGFPERIFGLAIRITSTGIPENTALVGDFRRARVDQRDPVTVVASTEHSTYFTENKVAILAEERLLMQVRRPSAFATITGI